MGFIDLWRYYCLTSRVNYIKTSKDFVNQDNKEHCISMMKGLADQTHRIYTAHIIVFNTKQ